ncbi:ABC transporter ATP-binding protein [Pseudogracilibacillus sp. SE30717A]|uniref:ABC transporter ATP-binding protein n=1 Tax=Pseudogracilibacillus sp. SE30717A TaxID=3098293 RepID=UPI00300E4C6E
MIDVTNVKQSFGKKTILQHVTFSIEKGEIVGLLGPSGSGKTTLIKALIGMLKPTEGDIYVLGVKQPSLKPMKHIGYMAQADALYQELTAKANLAYFGRLYGLRGKRLRERIQECLSFVDLDKETKKSVQHYSGGMKRRLSLAISLIHQPKLIFLDEPTVGIDPALKRVFWDEFHRLRNQGMGFLISTHIMDEAEHCDRILLVSNGRLIDAGSPEKLKQMYGSIEEAFLKAGEE